jgi:alkylation response protein AidB-like acyl-CoA dehydrogenase
MGELSAWSSLCPWPVEGDPRLHALSSYLSSPETVARLDALEATRTYPKDVLDALCDRGVLDFFTPPEDPGSKTCFTAWHLGALSSLLGRHSGSLAVTVGINGLALLPLFIGGTPEQLAWAFGNLRRRRFAALLVTELEASTDLLATQTRAEPVDGGYRVWGRKDLINGGHQHHMLVTLARWRQSQPPGPGDLVLLALERDSTVKNGQSWRTLPVQSADISSVSLEGTFVPASRRIGGEGNGFSLLQSALGVSRGVVGSVACGNASAARVMAEQHAGRHRLYGKPIRALPTVAEHLLKARAAEFLCAALALKALAQINLRGTSARYTTAIAKYLCPLLAEESIDASKRVMSARAMLSEERFERCLRDAQIYGIFEGTTDVMLSEVQARLVSMLSAKESLPHRDLGEAYRLPPRPVLEAVRVQAPVFVPEIIGHLKGLCDLPGDKTTLVPLRALAEGILGLARQARAQGIWESPHGPKHELASALANLEALVALHELGDPARRTALGMPSLELPEATGWVIQYAFAAWGGRLASRLRHLALRLELPLAPAVAHAEEVYFPLLGKALAQWQGLGASSK